MGGGEESGSEQQLAWFRLLDFTLNVMETFFKNSASDLGTDSRDKRKQGKDMKVHFEQHKLKVIMT